MLLIHFLFFSFFFNSTSLERSAFWKAFLLPAMMFFAAIIIFTSARRHYVIVPPEGSVLRKAFNAISFARKRHSKYKGRVPHEKNVTFKFLDYAKAFPEELAVNMKMDWDNKFVDELRQALKAF